MIPLIRSELKAVGLNKSAARYAGINEKKNIIL